MGDVDKEPNITAIIAKINNLRLKVDNYTTSLAENPLISRTSDEQTIMDRANQNLESDAQRIRDLILGLEPKRDGNYVEMENRAPLLLTQLNKMMKKYELAKNTVYADPLDGPHEVAQIKTDANFYAYVLSGICFVFVLGALMYIFKNPEVKNLDMFILVLAVIILAYYGYDYFYVRKSAAASNVASNAGATTNYITNYLSRLF